MRINVSYNSKWQLRNKPQYKWTECKRLFNTNTGREIKKTLKGMVAGYWIGKDFIKLSEMKNMVELIPKKEYCPF
jgi:hypothetical protein